MKAVRITPEKVRNLIKGAEMAGQKVLSIEVEGVVLRLEGAEVEDVPSKGQGVVNWSEK